MVTNKDLLEANSFSRRRLVAAFVSGARAGHELEPARPGRTIIGSLALAAVLVAGATLAGAGSGDDVSATSRRDPGIARTNGGG